MILLLPGQYPLKDMVDTLTKNGKKVRFAIHPVAGRYAMLQNFIASVC